MYVVHLTSITRVTYINVYLYKYDDSVERNSKLTHEQVVQDGQCNPMQNSSCLSSPSLNMLT